MNFMYIAAAALIDYDVANVLRIIVAILTMIMAIGLIVVVIMQKPVTNNIGTIAGEETQTYAGKNKAKSKESLLRKLTIILGIAISVLVIFFFITYLEV
jgi:preprotein translocase subunit SecG